MLPAIAALVAALLVDAEAEGEAVGAPDDLARFADGVVEKMARYLAEEHSETSWQDWLAEEAGWAFDEIWELTGLWPIGYGGGRLTLRLHNGGVLKIDLDPGADFSAGRRS